VERLDAGARHRLAHRAQASRFHYAEKAQSSPDRKTFRFTSRTKSDFSSRPGGRAQRAVVESNLF
jgi:hypothetical protein